MPGPDHSAHPHHPAAEAFPMMAGADFDRLVEDIRSHGLREAIWLDAEGRILDGRNRERACRLAAVPPAYRVHDGDDPTAFIVSLNLHRRHLSESQRAMVAARLATMRQGERTDLSPIGERFGQAEAARLLNVGKRNVERAARVREAGAPVLVRAVEEGKIAVSDAAAIVDRPPEEQATLIDSVRSGKHKTLRRAAAARRREQRETPPADMPAHDGRCGCSPPPSPMYTNTSSPAASIASSPIRRTRALSCRSTAIWRGPPPGFSGPAVPAWSWPGSPICPRSSPP